VDPHDRELTLSCGCALGHLCIALRHFHSFGGVDYLPGPHPDLLASVHLGPQGEKEPGESLLFDAIPLRRTNRQPFATEAVPDSLLKLLKSAAESEGAWLEFVQEEAPRAALAALVAEGDRRQWDNPAFRRELSQWLRANTAGALDGIPGYAVGVDDLLSYAGPLVVRTFDLGAGEAARDEEIALGSPVLAVLGTEGDGVRDWLNAGQALARVLLQARAANVWASFLNQPIEVPRLRARLEGLIGRAGHVQTVLRLGYGDAVKPTPRRPVEAVLM
jgi:hypothetical protein